MTRSLLAAALAMTAVPAYADSKAQSCDYQAQVVSAVQTARLERVAERKVEAHVLGTEPEWPAKYNKVIPLITPWVYEQKRAVIRKQDLGAAWREICLQQ